MTRRDIIAAALGLPAVPLLAGKSAIPWEPIKILDSATRLGMVYSALVSPHVTVNASAAIARATGKPLCIVQRVLYTVAEEGGYVITFPDIPEAITQGESIKDCHFQAQDALAVAMIERLNRNIVIPLCVLDKATGLGEAWGGWICVWVYFYGLSGHGTWIDVTRENMRPIYPNDSPLMRHAIDTFGSEEAAREWLSIKCGALNNQSPLDYIARTCNEAEVDRILGCIDYGIFA